MNTKAETQVVSVRVPRELVERFDAVIRQEQRTRQEVLEPAITETIERTLEGRSAPTGVAA